MSFRPSWATNAMRQDLVDLAMHPRNKPRQRRSTATPQGNWEPCPSGHSEGPTTPPQSLGSHSQTSRRRILSGRFPLESQLVHQNIHLQTLKAAWGTLSVGKLRDVGDGTHHFNGGSGAK